MEIRPDKPVDMPMICPRCQSGNVVIVGDLARCQTCDNYYDPQKFTQTAQDQVRSWSKEGEKAAWRGVAGFFTGTAVISLIIAGVLAAMVATGDGNYTAPEHLLAWSLACLVVSQLIHIRVNTEK